MADVQENATAEQSGGDAMPKVKSEKELKKERQKQEKLEKFKAKQEKLQKQQQAKKDTEVKFAIIKSDKE